MASVGCPLRVCRGILKELRAQCGHKYQESMAYTFVMEQFRKNQVTSEKLCRAQQELLHQAATYLCLLRSTRMHLALHEEYHGKGESKPEDVAKLVGLRLPQQPGGKGWEN
ncbi:protein FMC1 homolog [Erpetoichthys calabaricus]|uniref:Protein FMC1 homolog n=1 Tax=Erpetoichthys calabaricus TaxID=27687 RepID=A0A8C4SAT0_ERPCA|nr:protein FMC1 homolog [Erpetoichthys calabaricus]